MQMRLIELVSLELFERLVFGQPGNVWSVHFVEFKKRRHLTSRKSLAIS